MNDDGLEGMSRGTAFCLEHSAWEGMEFKDVSFFCMIA
jgi:hypothetical protein